MDKNDFAAILLQSWPWPMSKVSLITTKDIAELCKGLAEPMAAAHEQDKADALKAQADDYSVWKLEYGVRKAELEEAEDKIASLTAQVAVMAGLLQKAHDNMDWAGPEGDSATALLLEAIEQALESAPQVLFSGPATISHEWNDEKAETEIIPWVRAHIGDDWQEVNCIILARPEQAGDKEE